MKGAVRYGCGFSGNDGVSSRFCDQFKTIQIQVVASDLMHFCDRLLDKPFCSLYAEVGRFRSHSGKKDCRITC